MGDLFHEDISDATIGDVFDIMAMADHHVFQVLTKRPERMKELLTQWEKNPGAQPRRTRFDNIWLGVTAEDQDTACVRIPLLLDTPGEVRFVSVEPMLSSIWLAPFLHDVGCPKGSWNTPTCSCSEPREVRLDWVICGGETGPGARPMHPDWPRSLRDQCQAAGVPFFFKQFGKYGPCERWTPGSINLGDVSMKRVGNKSAGCLLDGREWKEFPPSGRETCPTR